MQTAKDNQQKKWRNNKIKTKKSVGVDRDLIHFSTHIKFKFEFIRNPLKVTSHIHYCTWNHWNSKIFKTHCILLNLYTKNSFKTLEESLKSPKQMFSHTQITEFFCESEIFKKWQNISFLHNFPFSCVFIEIEKLLLNIALKSHRFLIIEISNWKTT